MSVQGKIKRYTLIIEKLSKNQNTTLKALIEFLHYNGFENDKRTIQRDIRDLNNEFDIGITYNRSDNFYYLNSDNSLQLEVFLRFLGLANTASLLRDSFKNSRETLKYISFDNHNGLAGIHHLELFLKAIKEHKQVQFDHYSFQKDKTTKRILKPYLLKEYANRWYIIGKIEEVDEFRNFGIDRISNVESLENKFIPEQEIDIDYLYKDVIGLVYSENTMQRVVLAFTAEQGKYIKSLPLHNSQKVIADNDREFRISLDIIPNKSLTEHILKLGNKVKVIEPIALVEEIKGILEVSLSQYK